MLRGIDTKCGDYNRIRNRKERLPSIYDIFENESPVVCNFALIFKVARAR